MSSQIQGFQTSNQNFIPIYLQLYYFNQRTAYPQYQQTINIKFDKIIISLIILEGEQVIIIHYQIL
ncbi:hypothetical protein pb186bvf_020924 [Paramecium bursaria]